MVVLILDFLWVSWFVKIVVVSVRYIDGEEKWGFSFREGLFIYGNKV